MFDLNLTTPALLFPTISLIMLAYTNRFLALATLIRQLHAAYLQQPRANLLPQIQNLAYRLRLIRYMQLFGVATLLGCVLCMLALYVGWFVVGKVLFGVNLGMLSISLILSIYEVQLSTAALRVELSDLQQLAQQFKADV
jgi:hypothetical protein